MMAASVLLIAIFLVVLAILTVVIVTAVILISRNKASTPGAAEKETPADQVVEKKFE